MGYEWDPPSNSVFQFDFIEKEALLGALINHSPEASESIPLFNDQTQQIIALICNEASFLVDDRVKKMCEENGIEGEQKYTLQMNSIMKSLKIETVEEADIFFSYFVITKTSPEGEEPEVQLIQPHNVLTALKGFVADQQGRPKEKEKEKDKEGKAGYFNITAVMIFQKSDYC
jgi:hypothetical protein